MTVKLMTDEELVRASWPQVQAGFYAPLRGIPGFYAVDTPGWRFSGCTEEIAWAAAAEYTRERLERIREIEEEMTVIGKAVRVFPFHAKPCIRILDRLESALADLRKWMRA